MQPHHIIISLEDFFLQNSNPFSFVCETDAIDSKKKKKKKKTSNIDYLHINVQYINIPSLKKCILYLHVAQVVRDRHTVPTDMCKAVEHASLSFPGRGTLVCFHREDIWNII